MPSCSRKDLEWFLEEMEDYDKIFYKWLSKNDYIWSEKENIHQSGILIPREHLNFFNIERLPSSNLTKRYDIYWIFKSRKFTRGDVKYSRGDYATLKYYTGGNRGSRPETHLTNVYNPYFKKLEAPLFLLARMKDNSSIFFNAIIIDRDGLIQSIKSKLDMPEGSLWGVLNVENNETSYDFNFSEDFNTTLFDIAKKKYNRYKKIPGTKVTSDTVWNIAKNKDYGYLLKSQFKLRGLSQSKNPFETLLSRKPGDLIRWALTVVEMRLVKMLEEIHYPRKMISKLKNNNFEDPFTWDELERMLEMSLDDIINIAKGITNSRRSRAGYSFECHIANLLDISNVEFERQSGKKRIDFKIFTPDEEINLSAKTTARERWKQIHENFYFITIDRRISKNKIKKMRNKNIKIIVPETDIIDIEYYKSEDYILSYRDFINEVLDRNERRY